MLTIKQKRFIRQSIASTICKHWNVIDFTGLLENDALAYRYLARYVLALQDDYKERKNKK